MEGPAAADTEEDVGMPEAAVEEPTPAIGCCVCSGSSRTESSSKLILTCDQRCVVCCSFLRRTARLLVAALSSLPSSDSFFCLFAVYKCAKKSNGGADASGDK